MLRYNAKVKFTHDEQASVHEGVEQKGRPFTDECGWLGREGNKRRRYVRRITLQREEGDEVAIVTDLVDPRKYPAKNLLALYRERWGMEQMFQQVTEVFGLEKLIGGRPEATIFQLAFCLLLYNQMQLVRAYVLKHQGEEIESVSLEQLYIDVRRELIAWAVVVGTIDLPRRSTGQTQRRLDKLLKNPWSDRWVKAIKQSGSSKSPLPRTKTHTSAYRALLAPKQ